MRGHHCCLGALPLSSTRWDKAKDLPGKSDPPLEERSSPLISCAHLARARIDTCHLHKSALLFGIRVLREEWLLSSLLEGQGSQGTQVGISSAALRS